MKSSFSLRATLVLSFGSLLLSGCGKSEPPAQPATRSNQPAAQSAPSDPDDVPISEADVEMPANYDAALEQIKQSRDSIRSAVEGGTPTKAHRPLDELDIVLNKLPSIARDSGVPKEKWEEVNTTARELRDSFNQVHSAIDERREPDYGAVAEPIEQAIKRLEDVTAAESPTQEQSADSSASK